MTQTQIDKMNSRASASFNLGCVKQSGKGFIIEGVKGPTITYFEFFVEANAAGDLFCKCTSHSITCRNFEAEGVCEHILAAEMLAGKILEEAALENSVGAEISAETAKAEMLCVSARRIEFVPALERAAKSNLTVYADFEPDTFVVVNKDNGNEYRVNMKTIDGQLFSDCECEDYCYRRRVCKHIVEVIFFSSFRKFGAQIG
ncbi:MAG: SWIM zinc finger family protein [Pyrinomonadaceae bacterium]